VGTTHPGLPPLTRGLPPAPRTVRREGRTLVVARDGTLPGRCIRCGAAGDGAPITRRLTWHHPALYLLLLLGVIPYIILALSVQKRTRVTMSVCARHRAIRRRSLWGAWTLLAASIATGVAAIALEDGAVGALAVLMLIAAPVLGICGRRLVTASGIDGHHVRATGAGRGFLDTLTDEGREEPRW